MANLYSYRSVLKRLNSLKINWKAGITVQTLTPHPYHPTSFLWSHNVLEKKPTNLARFNYMPKPDGWGNGGGGLERLIHVPSLDKYLTELEILKFRRPGHPILMNESLSEEMKIILAGGLREHVDETGFRDIEIRTDFPGIFLSDHVYPPWIDAKGIIYAGGHRKITLLGKLNSLREDPIIESNEIDKTAWFDLAESLPKQFFNRAPERPYLSHVLSTLGGVLRAYRHEKSIQEGPVPNIPGRVHSSWWYIHQVGRGDWRFPEKGCRLSPRQWYKLFGHMVKYRMEEADNDFLIKFLGRDLDDARRREEVEFNLAEISVGSDVVTKTQKLAQAVEGSEDSDRIPMLEEIWQKEYEAEYLRWYEEKLPSHLRV